VVSVLSLVLVTIRSPMPARLRSGKSTPCRKASALPDEVEVERLGLAVAQLGMAAASAGSWNR
jgi:hypothetical protein